MTFGQRFRRLTARRGVSLREVGRVTKISHEHVRKLSLDMSTPSADKLDRVSRFFDVSMDELWRGTGRCTDANLGLSPGAESDA